MTELATKILLGEKEAAISEELLHQCKLSESFMLLFCLQRDVKKFPPQAPILVYGHASYVAIVIRCIAISYFVLGCHHMSES